MNFKKTFALVFATIFLQIAYAKIPEKLDLGLRMFAAGRHAEGVKLVKPYADQDSLPAMRIMMLAYREGHGVPQNKEIADMYAKRMAEVKSGAIKDRGTNKENTEAGTVVQYSVMKLKPGMSSSEASKVTPRWCYASSNEQGYICQWYRTTDFCDEIAKKTRSENQIDMLTMDIREAARISREIEANNQNCKTNYHTSEEYLNRFNFEDIELQLVQLINSGEAVYEYYFKAFTTKDSDKIKSSLTKKFGQPKISKVKYSHDIVEHGYTHEPAYSPGRPNATQIVPTSTVVGKRHYELEKLTWNIGKNLMIEYHRDAFRVFEIE